MTAPAPRLGAGVACKMASALCMTLMMACVKALDGALPVGQVVFWRAAVTLAPLLAWLLWRRLAHMLFDAAALRRHLGRGLSGSASMILIFVTLACLPLTEAVMLGYAAPLMTVLLARSLLREGMPGHRWVGALLGAAGIALALGPQPSGAGSGAWTGTRWLGVAAGLGGALFAALSTIQIRQLSATERPGDIVLYYTLTTALLGGATAAFGWERPDAGQAWLMLGAGVLSGLAQWLIVLSLRHASASLVAPFEYSTLLWSMLIAWIAFGGAPAAALLAGGALILASGLFAFGREWRPIGRPSGKEERGAREFRESAAASGVCCGSDHLDGEFTMTPWTLRWIRALSAGVLLAGLTGCATRAPTAPEPLLHDALFGHPTRPAAADDAMRVDASMRRYVQDLLADKRRDRNRPRTLADALYAPGQLQLEYDMALTRTAAQAFAARAGNCLSLVLMTAALAREMGLEVDYQSARMVESYSRSGDLTVRSGHVNLVLAPRALRWNLDVMAYSHDPDALLIDFLPPASLRGLRSVSITEQRVLAMFMNNRAAESLQGAAREAGLAPAYAWVREALRQDAGFWPAYNTLGVIYQRGGHLAQAAAAFEAALVQDPQAVPAMANLGAVLRTLGRHDEAAVWDARRAALQPDEPFHFLDLGEAALAAGDLARAEALFDREQGVTGLTHELAYQRARLHAARGETRDAQAALQQALATSDTRHQQQAYAAKLERLRAQLTH